MHKAIADASGMELYLSLHAHFAGLGKIDWDEAVSGMHIVYAWMPKILSPRPVEDIQPKVRVRILQALNKARKTGELDEHDLEVVAILGAGSVVAASKLLHFLNPDAFPIWDRRVARAFLRRAIRENSAGQRPLYLEYRTTLQQWSRDPEVIGTLNELRGLSKWLKTVSVMRLLELPLFKDGKKSAKG